MTLEQLKQYRAWRISLQSMRAELKQRHCELLQMENTGVLAQNEQARQRLYALEAQLAQSYLEKEAAIREVEQWIAQLPGFKAAVFGWAALGAGGAAHRIQRKAGILDTAKDDGGGQTTHGQGPCDRLAHWQGGSFFWQKENKCSCSYAIAPEAMA